MTDQNWWEAAPLADDQGAAQQADEWWADAPLAEPSAPAAPVNDEGLYTHQAARFNRGVMSTAGLIADSPAHLYNYLRNSGSHGTGALPALWYNKERGFHNPLPERWEPGLSEPIVNAGERLGMYNDQQLTPANARERYAGRAAEFVGAGAVPAAGFAAGARAPAAFMAADAAIGTGQGLAYEGILDATGGNETAAAAGSLAVPFTPAAASIAARSALGGGSARMGEALSDAASVPGYTPSAGEAGGNFLTRWFERLGQNSLGSSSKIADRMDETDETLRRTLEDLSERVESAAGVSAGTAQTAEGAGLAIRKGISEDADAWMTKSKRQARDAEQKANDAITAAETATGAPLRISVQPVLDRFDGTIARRDILGDVADRVGDPDVTAIRNALEDLADGAGTIGFAEARELKAMVGNMTNFNVANPNRDTALWRSVYGAIAQSTKDAIETLPSVRIGGRTVSPKTAFAAAQGKWVKHFDRVENFYDPMMRKAAEPDALAKWVVKPSGGSNSPVRIREVREMAGQRRWNQVRAYTLRQMGRARPSSIDGALEAGEEAFSPTTFVTNWNRMRQDGSLGAVFDAKKGTKWAELKTELDNFARVVGRVQESRTALANPSGTASRLLAHQQLTTTSGAAVASAMTGNPTILGTVLAAQGSIAIGARAMINPKFVRWLAKDGELPLHRLPSAIARLNQIIAKEEDPEARAEMEAMRAGLRARVMEGG